MVASIPKSYQVDLTNSYLLTGHFSQRGGLVPRQANKISQLMQGFLLIPN
jgi:hypothetical protein